MQPVSILIVEDHYFTADGLQTHLIAAGFAVTGSARTAEAGERMAWEQAPQLILLDLHLPDESSPRRLLSRFCDDVPWKVAILSGDERPAIVQECLDCGASAFLSKGENPVMMMTALRLIHSGVSPVVLTTEETDCCILSTAETEILKLMAKGCKYQDIASVRGTTAETVRKQCDRIQIKLGLASREHLLLWASKNGYAAIA